MEEIYKNLEIIALELVTLTPRDNPALERVFNCLSHVEERARLMGHPLFMDLVLALKRYLEKIISKETENITPFEEGVLCLQSFYHTLNNQEEFREDISHVFRNLESSKVPQPPDGEGRGVLEEFAMDSMEHIRSIESGLMDLKRDRSDMDAIDAVLRPFHAIKRASAFLGFPSINKLTQSAGNLLEQVKKNNGQMPVMIPDLLLETATMLGAMITGLQDGTATTVFSDDGLDPDSLADFLDEIAVSDHEIEEAPGQVENHPMELACEPSKAETASTKRELELDEREILEDFVLESLESLGSIEASLVALERNPEDKEAINAIFRPFHTIKGVSAFLGMEEINRLAHGAENLLDQARNGEIRLGAAVIDLILETVDLLQAMVRQVQNDVAQGSLSEPVFDPAPLIERLNVAGNGTGQTEPGSGEELPPQRGTRAAADFQAGGENEKGEPEKKNGEPTAKEGAAMGTQPKVHHQRISHHVKVDSAKLDTLVDLTGELVIAQSMLRQNPSVLSINDQKLYQNLRQLAQITSGLQTVAMSMRMVPIKSTFQKMVRLVRDLEKNSGKRVSLEMAGEETEIDRNMVEALYEPLVHMIRNAVDHGIELPEERAAKGKPGRGTIGLRAFQKGGHIIVEIEDDGRGLNREKIVAKARAANLITDDKNWEDSEVYSLIFQPGFSTAEKVTEISGRGVGMDVVKKEIEKLKGRMEIHSSPGAGSIFSISLPLTLAIIEGMTVRVGREHYIIPALAILESLRPERSQYFTVEGKGEMIMRRGHLTPLIRLDNIFNVQGDTTHPWEGLVVAVEHEGEERCLLLDELLGKEEVVIKSLGESMQNIKGISGGAIMGDGRVGLILDMAGLFEIVRGEGNRR